MTPIPRLSGDDRRAQIIEAVTPAVLEHGAAITSRQLADAAGVAEGTLFKAFGDKESLLTALAAHHMTDEGTEALPSDSLEVLAETMVSVLVERMRFMYRLAMALGPIAQRVAAERRDAVEESRHWIAAHFEPYEQQLSVTPLVAADLVRALAWAGAAAWGEDSPVSSADDIIQVLLHGIVRAPAPADASARTPPAGPPASAPETQKV